MRPGRRLAAILALAACAVTGVVASPSGARPTHTTRASGSDGYFSLSMTGPTSLELSRTAAPPRQEFDVTMDYIGPAFQQGDAPLNGTITVQLSPQEMNFGIGCCLPPANCTDSPPQNTPATTWSCPFSVYFGSGTHFTFPVGVRPTGKEGTGALTVSLSTGASASVTTTYAFAAETTTEETTTTAPTTTVAAAPTTTLTESFTASTPPQAEAATVSPAADTVSLALTWPSSADSFDVTGITITQNGQVVARTLSSAAVRRLIVVKTRTATSLKVTIKNPVRGKLRFTIAARKLHKATRVKATIRQTKKR